MNAHKKLIASLCGLAAVLFSVIAKADTVLTFDIDVTGCSSQSSLCGNSFQPYHFLETWTLTSYAAGSPNLYDFGNGNSLLRATTVSDATVSASSNLGVLTAAGMSSSDVKASFFAENGMYLTNGVGTGYNTGDLQFRNQSTLKPPNGDGTYEYKNYAQSLYFYLSGTSFTNIVTITPSVLATYLTPGTTVGWGESGSVRHLPDCCLSSGTLVSDLNYSGTATFVGIQTAPVPEPETYAMLLAGLGLIGTIGRRRSMTVAASA